LYGLVYNARLDLGIQAPVLREMESVIMREKIHPKYVECKVRCACGNDFVTRSTKPELHVDICASCHPFFTGKQKFVDTAGRVEKFQKKFAGQYFGKPAGGSAKKGDKAAKA